MKPFTKFISQNREIKSTQFRRGVWQSFIWDQELFWGRERERKAYHKNRKRKRDVKFLGPP